MAKREIEYEQCMHCGGEGKTPSAGTGAILRAERKAAGVSLALLASELDISIPYLADLERGNRNWSNARVAAFRRALKELG